MDREDDTPVTSWLARGRSLNPAPPASASSSSSRALSPPTVASAPLEVRSCDWDGVWSATVSPQSALLVRQQRATANCVKVMFLQDAKPRWCLSLVCRDVRCLILLQASCNREHHPSIFREHHLPSCITKSSFIGASFLFDLMYSYIYLDFILVDCCSNRS